MKSAIAATLIATASASLLPKDVASQKYMWESFKQEHNKKYASETEEGTRFQNFLQNLKVADMRNAMERKSGGSATHGVTQFFDLTQSEYKARYTTSDISKKTQDRNVDNTVYVASTTAQDWTGIYTTPVKNQGYCGSCWAFSATEQIESDTMRTLNTTYILSPEQIVQCDKTSFGCNGGFTESAYKYVKNAGGLSQNADYPYTSYLGVTGTCSASSSKFVVTATSYSTIGGSSTSAIETNMANYMLSTGPLSVCVDASNWNSYTGGIMSVCGQNVDHCVQAVGVDTSSNGYWKVRNSWGTSWGESGYIRLAYGKNTCDITNDPTWTAVKLV
jgi:C1A family cysteine protease